MYYVKYLGCDVLVRTRTRPLVSFLIFSFWLVPFNHSCMLCFLVLFDMMSVPLNMCLIFFNRLFFLFLCLDRSCLSFSDTVFSCRCVFLYKTLLCLSIFWTVYFVSLVFFRTLGMSLVLIVRPLFVQSSMGPRRLLSKESSRPARRCDWTQAATSHSVEHITVPAKVPLHP